MNSPAPTEPSDHKKRRLTAQDWTWEALTAIEEGGVKAVSVEGLAKRLGATKGSFYWHFRNRPELIAAALQLWEKNHTEAIVSYAQLRPSPAERLRALFELVLEYSRNDRVEVALLASAHDPEIGPTLRRVTRRRIEYVAEQYRDLGLSAEQADHRATVAVSVYLGHVQMAHVSSDLLPINQAQWEIYITDVVDTLVPPSN